MKERAASTEKMLNDEFRKLEESVNRELTSNESLIRNAINAHTAYFHERRSLNNFHRDRVITFEQIAE
ncbi:TPA: MbeB family mobilization protein [Escherichia coli]